MTRTTSLRLPTRARDWQLIGRTIQLVLGIPRYTILAVLASVGSLSLFVLSRNLDLFVNVILLGNLSPTARFTVLVGLFPLVGNAYAVTSSILLIATAVLVGIDIALLTYYLRHRRLSVREGSGSLVGVVFGTLGAGCASCGAAVLAGLFSLVGAGGVLTLLPLDGLEFTLVALVVLVLSVYWLAEGLRGGIIRGCPVEVDSR